MKNQPYKEILYFESEYKEYKKLCKSKSKKFTYYSDWEKYLYSRFKQIPEEHLNDYKHYVGINYSFENHSKNISLSLLIAYIPIAMNYSSNYFIVDIILYLFLAFQITIVYFDFVRREKFRKDIAEILDKYLLELYNGTNG